MPMVLMSGWIAADALDADYGGAGAGTLAEASAAKARQPVDAEAV